MPICAFVRFLSYEGFCERTPVTKNQCEKKNKKTSCFYYLLLLLLLLMSVMSVMFIRDGCVSNFKSRTLTKKNSSDLLTTNRIFHIYSCYNDITNLNFTH